MREGGELSRSRTTPRARDSFLYPLSMSKTERRRPTWHDEPIPKLENIHGRPPPAGPARAKAVASGHNEAARVHQADRRRGSSSAVAARGAGAAGESGQISMRVDGFLIRRS